jgi:two-component system, sensor histidine kinase and response regulator
MDSTKQWRIRPIALPILVFLIGMPASVVMYFAVLNSVTRLAQLQFEREANAANSILEIRLHSYTHVLYALRAQFAAEAVVDRVRFHRFVKSLDIQRRYPGFLAINYAAYVPGYRRRQFEASVRADTSIEKEGYPNFSIKPPGERPEYFVIVYIEPMPGSEFALGLDLGANPMAKDSEKVAMALRVGRDTGNLTSSAQPLRVQRPKQPIYLAMRLAVYRVDATLETIE